MADTEGSGSGAMEEISLIDLLAVLIRHRRTIILSTACAAILALAYNLIFPAWQAEKAKSNRLVEASMALRLEPSLRTLAALAGAEDVVSRAVSDPAVLLRAMRKAGILSIDTVSIGEGAGDTALMTVRRRLVENKSVDGDKLKEEARIYLSKREYGSMVLTYKSKDSAQALAFLQALYAEIEEVVRASLGGVAHSEIENYNVLINIQNPSEGVMNLLREGLARYTSAKRYLAGDLRVFEAQSAPSLLEPEDRLESLRAAALRNGILLVIGVLFLSVLVAFIEQAIESTKNDPAAMAKLRSAWERK